MSYSMDEPVRTPPQKAPGGAGTGLLVALVILGTLFFFIIGVCTKCK